MILLDRTLVGLVILWVLVSVLPLGAWVGMAPADHYTESWGLWARTGLVVVLATLLLLVVSRGEVARGLRRALAWGASIPLPVLLGMLGVVAAVEAVAVSVWCFERNPQLIDTWAQYFQARILAAGRLTAPPPPSIAHFAILHTLVTDRSWFGQYPPVHPGLLAAGMMFGVPWLVTPLLAALLPAAVYAAASRVGDERIARLAAVLTVCSPFVIAMSASGMNHVPAALCVAVGLWALPDVVRGGRAAGLVLGAAVGLQAGLRPVEAIVLAAVGGGALLFAVARRRNAVVAVAVLGAALATLIPTLAYNTATTGHPLTFGYAALWRGTPWLGFHRPVPWGQPLTPARAVGFTALDAHQLNVYLLEWPLPVTLLAGLGLWRRGARLGPGLRAAAALLLALVGVLFFHFHRDTLYGPRYLFSAVPALLVLVAAGLVRLGDVRRAIGWRALGVGDVAVVALVVMGALSAGLLAPWRLATYSTRGTALALHPDRDAARAGLSNAVVVIPDGWGTRLIVRLWDAGVPMVETTRLYAAFDACALEERLAAAEAAGVRGEALLPTLREASRGADGGRRAPGVTPDPLLRLPSDGRITPRCADEIARDQRGTLQFAPFLYLNTPALDGDVVWARGTGALDARLARLFPGRSIYRYERSPGANTGTFVPLTPRLARSDLVAPPFTVSARPAGSREAASTPGAGSGHLGQLASSPFPGTWFTSSRMPSGSSKSTE